MHKGFIILDRSACFVMLLLVDVSHVLKMAKNVLFAIKMEIGHR